MENLENNVKTSNFTDEEFETMVKKNIETDENRIKMGKVLLLPSVMLAAFIAFCEYDTYSFLGIKHCGLTTLLITIAELVYVFVISKLLNRKIKATSIFYMIAIGLLAVATFLSDDGFLGSINKYAIVVLSVSLLINVFVEDGVYGILEHVSAWFKAVFGGLTMVDSPVRDLSSIKKNSKEKKVDTSNLLKVLIGIGISIPLLAVILSLLCSADAVFANLFKNFVPEFDVGSFISFMFIFSLAFFVGYGLVRYIASPRFNMPENKTKKSSAIIAITIGVLISIVYGAFSIVQFVYLFGKHALPEGYTYATYAKEGVFQLMWLSILNLVIVILGIALFEKNSILKFLLTFISACTYLMITSSSYRLWQYINLCNGLTRKRIWGIWGLLTVSICFVGVIIYIYKEDFKLYRFGLSVILATYLVLAFLKPDYIIAKANLDILPSVIESDIDTALLERLGEDAYPVMKNHDSDWVYRVGFHEYDDHCYGNTSNKWKYINVSDMIVRKVINK